MAFFDLPLQELEVYCPERNEPSDFDAFWQATLEEARSSAFTPKFTLVDEPLAFIDVYDVSYSGYAGQGVKAWLYLPKAAKQPLPCVVEFVGYGGGRGRPLERLQWANAGYAYFLMDTRGQGSSWSVGDTPDLPEEGSGPHYPGFMTQGILNPKSYYFRRLYTDAVRAVETARDHPRIDANRVAITGGSQGGGVCIAAAGLMPEIPVAMPDVPFLCHFERATQLVDSFPYQEIAAYCRIHRDQIETVFRTLSYFDGMNFAPRAQARALFSAGLMDDVCPPSTVFAAYNHYAGEKQVRVYPYNQHDGGGIDHLYEKIRFLKELWPLE